MEVTSGTIYNCSTKNDKGFKVKIHLQTEDRVAVLFLEPTSFCFKGYYKWYFKSEFFNVFTLWTSDQEKPTLQTL